MSEAPSQVRALPSPVIPQAEPRSAGRKRKATITTSCGCRWPGLLKRARAADTVIHRTARAKRFSNASGATSPTTPTSQPVASSETEPTHSTSIRKLPLSKLPRGDRGSRPRGADNSLCSASKAKSSQSVARRRSLATETKVRHTKPTAARNLCR